jgi:hypothetical protein
MVARPAEHRLDVVIKKRIFGGLAKGILVLAPIAGNALFFSTELLRNKTGKVT